MCGAIPDMSFTEDICDYCKNEEKACACRNSEHTLTDPVKFAERIIAQMRGDRVA